RAPGPLARARHPRPRTGCADGPLGRAAQRGAGRQAGGSRGDAAHMSTVAAVTGIQIGLEQVAASLVLIAVAIAVSFWRGAGIENEIAVAVIRSFIQLTAIGYVIQLIFDQDSLLLVFALLSVMVIFGVFTARQRARR